MDKTNIEFQTKLNFKEYRDFNFYHFYKNFKSKIFLLCLPLILIGLPVLSYYYVKTEDIFLLLLISADLVLFIFMVLLLPLSIIVTTKLSVDNDKLLQTTQHYIIDAASIYIKTGRIEDNKSWKEIYKAIETKNYFFIYLTKVRAFIIPKNQIDEEQIKILKEKVYCWKSNK